METHRRGRRGKRRLLRVEVRPAACRSANGQCRYITSLAQERNGQVSGGELLGDLVRTLPGGVPRFGGHGAHVSETAIRTRYRQHQLPGRKRGREEISGGTESGHQKLYLWHHGPLSV